LPDRANRPQLGARVDRGLAAVQHGLREHAPRRARHLREQQRWQAAADRRVTERAILRQDVRPEGRHRCTARQAQSGDRRRRPHLTGRRVACAIHAITGAPLVHRQTDAAGDEGTDDRDREGEANP
jgi:hypothetical protein